MCITCVARFFRFLAQRTRNINVSGVFVTICGVKNDAHCLFSALVSHHGSKSEVNFMLRALVLSHA